MRSDLKQHQMQTSLSRSLNYAMTRSICHMEQRVSAWIDLCKTSLFAWRCYQTHLCKFQRAWCLDWCILRLAHSLQRCWWYLDSDLHQRILLHLFGSSLQPNAPSRNDPSCCIGKIDATLVELTRPVNTTYFVSGNSAPTPTAGSPHSKPWAIIRL